jgi:putative PIN family toxin of toxin-antitoxin system
VLRVVIDTNVLVSSAISKGGNPAKIMNLCFVGSLQVFYTAEIFDEYKRVLSYKRLSIAEELQNDIINAIEEVGTLINPTVSKMPIPDETDRTFYDTALLSGAILITGNIKHFPTESFIMTPTDCLQKMISW